MQNNNLWRLTRDAFVRYKDFGVKYEAAAKDLDALVNRACEVCGPHLTYEEFSRSTTQLKAIRREYQELEEKHKQLQQEHHKLQLLLKKSDISAKRAWTLLIVMFLVTLLILCGASAVNLPAASAAT